MKRAVTTFIALAAALLHVGVTAAHGADDAPPPVEVHAVIDVSRHFQTIDHFGASDCWSMQAIGQWSEPNRQKVAELLFSQEKGIGLSMWRFNLSAGLNKKIPVAWRTADGFETAPGKYDWSRQPGQRWFLRAAKRMGVPRFLAFCNSPPARLTRNGLTNLGDASPAQTTNLKPNAEGEFARYMADILEHFQNHPDPAERVAFDWVSPINEPEWDWNEKSRQEGCRYANADIKPVAAAMARELARRRLPARLCLIEAGSLYDLSSLNKNATSKRNCDCGNYIELLCKDPVIAPAMGRTIAYHSYWTDGPGQLVPARRALRAKLDAMPDWSAWMTEYCVMESKRDLGIDTALRVAKVIHADLAVAGVSAWNWWTAVSNVDYKDGLIYTDCRKPNDPESIHVSKTLWALGNFSRFIRPGMCRIDVRIDKPDRAPAAFLCSAYLNPANGQVVVIAINSGDAAARLQLSVQSKAGAIAMARWTRYVTSAAPDDELRRLEPVSATNGLTIFARSIVTALGSRY